MVLECDLLGLVGEEQLNVERRMVMGDGMGEVDDEDESLGASESFLKGSGLEVRMSMTFSSNPFTSSIRAQMTLSDGGDGDVTSGLKLKERTLFVSTSFSTTGESRTFTDSSPIDP